MEKTTQNKNPDPLARIPQKLKSEIRYLSFNVNGCKTLFNYHPWNQLQGNFNTFLSALDGDIVSLQELKIQSDAVGQFGILSDYKAFISIPKSKKGYSGVGLFVRLPRSDDPPQVQQALTVIKAEEGITGRLIDKVKGVAYNRLPEIESIGGYLSEEDIVQLGISEQELLSLDSEGRCSVAEFANNTVLFSLYCPANSMGTPEGQVFRLNFLEMMFRRCANLKKLGKKVVVMGDINISPDLIDSAETINELLKKKIIVNNLSEGGEEFEKKNMSACLSFQSSTPHRSLLHRFMFSSLEAAPKYPTQFLFDTTRITNKHKLALYTVWNTMTNARQSNFGSRIDLILISSKEDLDNVARANILPYILGSDHCPIITDISVSHQEVFAISPAKKLSFEAKTFYKLIKHHDIAALFSTAAVKRNSDSESPDTTDLNSSSSSDSSKVTKKPKSTSQKKISYTGRKPTPSKHSQQPIENFFFQAKPRQDPSIANNDQAETKKPTAVDVVSQYVSLVYDNPPLCHHNEKCTLKTSKTQSSKGKNFWCCARSSKGGTTELGEHRCNFFEWTKKPNGS